MVITESELRELWRDGRHALPAFPPGTRFTPAAHDFLKAHGLEVRFEAPSSAPRPSPAADGAFAAPANPAPASDLPRLKLHARLDSLQALFGLVAAEARRYQLPELAAALDALAAYCPEILAAERHGRPVSPLPSSGRADGPAAGPELNSAPFVPGPHDHAILHWLNVARTQAREAQVLALETYPPPARPDLAEALGQLSGAAEQLALRLQAGQLGWKPGPRG